MGGSTTGAVNQALYLIGVLSVLLFAGIVFFMVYFAVRYRASRNPRATEIHGNNLLEVVWIVVPTLLALGMFWAGLTGYQFLRNAPAGAFEVKVHSKQWAWLFEYPGGKFSNDLVVPTGRDIFLKLTSDDVIHGFYLPDYRVQVDTVPGMETTAWFRAKELGTADILCTVYCGTAHSGMMAHLQVLPKAAWDEWSAGKAVAAADGMDLPPPGPAPAGWKGLSPGK